jgi:hypothetical protein
VSGTLLQYASFALDESAPDHSAIFTKARLMDVEQHECSSGCRVDFPDLLVSSTTRVNVCSLLSGLEGERNLSREPTMEIFLNWVGRNRDSISGTRVSTTAEALRPVSRGFPVPRV